MERHQFQPYPKSKSYCGVMIDNYARCALLASADIHSTEARCVKCGYSRNDEDHDNCEKFGDTCVFPNTQSPEAQCAGLKGCHELEGVVYDLFVHDPNCPKSSPIAEELQGEVRCTCGGKPHRASCPVGLRKILNIHSESSSATSPDSARDDSPQGTMWKIVIECLKDDTVRGRVTELLCVRSEGGEGEKVTAGDRQKAADIIDAIHRSHLPDVTNTVRDQVKCDIAKALADERKRVVENTRTPSQVELSTPSDVDQLLFKLAAQDCQHLAAGMNDCTEELAVADWCVVCQAREILQKYSRAPQVEGEAAWRPMLKHVLICSGSPDDCDTCREAADLCQN